MSKSGDQFLHMQEAEYLAGKRQGKQQRIDKLLYLEKQSKTTTKNNNNNGYNRNNRGDKPDTNS